MATVLVFNNDRNLVERYELAENNPMPYNSGGTLLVREFRGSSRGQYLWTDKRTMESWNILRTDWGRGIYVGYCFKRIWEGGHSAMSQHYAGTAFDIAQNLTNTTRNRLWQVAQRSGAWVYVEPQNLTPTWIHVDKRFTPPACATGGYPLVRRGMRDQYIMILQDGLTALGFSTQGLDGVFGANTETAVRNFQRSKGLTADGIVGCNTWRLFTSTVVGMGRTATTLP